MNSKPNRHLHHQGEDLISIAARLSAAARYAERIAECLTLHEIDQHVAHNHRVSLVKNIEGVKEDLSAIALLDSEIN